MKQGCTYRVCTLQNAGRQGWSRAIVVSKVATKGGDAPRCGPLYSVYGSQGQLGCTFVED